MPEEKIELTELLVRLSDRLIQLETQVYTLMMDQPKGGQLLTPKQLDELTSKVEQNLTRKLRMRLENR